MQNFALSVFIQALGIVKHRDIDHSFYLAKINLSEAGSFNAFPLEISKLNFLAILQFEHFKTEVLFSAN